MTHDEKVQWMAVWAARNGFQLELNGEVGIGRECVGILRDGVYPDYEWHDRDTWDRLDDNGEVWTPTNAYHKHPCVAVLGRGEEAEAQLYEWLVWFDKEGFRLDTGEVALQSTGFEALIQTMLGQHRYARLVR